MPQRGQAANLTVLAAREDASDGFPSRRASRSTRRITPTTTAAMTSIVTKITATSHPPSIPRVMYELFIAFGAGLPGTRLPACQSLLKKRSPKVTGKG
jgi:capsular polysaccharide biosynthesis protein